MKPKVFVASASESLEVAYAVQEELGDDAEVTVWSQYFGVPMRTVLETLLDVLQHTEFAVFVFSPHDAAVIRGEERPTVRDNVLFELGLFVGRLGRERNFILVPKVEPSIRLPTDLLGVVTLDYDPERSDRNLRAALGPSCNRIRTILRAPKPSMQDGEGASSTPSP
ncbi:MAG TPA: nucleotide-binding protein, partial [Longimicrobium sp.]|nr:nucleotide-binding protein [Longimicrobium sp.]